MQLIQLLALLPVAFAIEAVNKAGGSQYPAPEYPTAPLTPVPTVATIITINGTMTSNAPLPATTPLTYPLLNTSAISTNNLSSTTKKPSSSVILITTTGEGGQQSTITSFVGAPGETPTGAGGANPTGGTQPGMGATFGEGKAIAALVAFGGAVAMLL